MVFTVLIKTDTEEAFFILFFISMKTNSEQINCQACTIVMLCELLPQYNYYGTMLIL